ncbi:MAG: hypothetical protein J6J27_04060 [Alphaproteobacteria bacterium]|nr:hypothetical protein [Alphaproteobacteria bacterium]
MNLPKPKKIYYSPFYKDKTSHIKKRRFIINCDSCTIYQNKGVSGCKSLGYCKFSKFYEELNKDYSELQRMRIVTIMMSGYNNPRC